ncbi:MULTISPECIES: sodium:calcium antiporter [unclassified Carboxydocella]|uniref:sodium:calcium antiporter n=1 Tax=unclassified Carboxydocella TaxID=2685367 RepID=UPI0009AC5A47|nr:MULTISPECIES: sodium:calcium antiporter [unclassified Carboxydocella]GAW28666.1 hypothetical protein ULO1_12360 [Carboxydocella sp. ULO1]GAW30511.1 hypothetical protein JDF658_02760 [Carboxydocella sp. JDF658]
MLEIGILLVSLGVILLGAELFTNGVEWLGKRLGMNEGAVGSILAAVGTALPETLVPIIAILFNAGREAGTEIGIGAILGAPFMLGTLAFCVSGLAALAFAYRRPSRTWMTVDKRVVGRDLRFFLLVYALAIVASFLTIRQLKLAVAVALLGAYIIYAYKTIQDEEGVECECLSPLTFARNNPNPALGIILLQVVTALGAIVLGAEYFVKSLEVLSGHWGISPLVLSLIITPIATELPEKFNSVIWIRQGRDTLALGNISGAMVFQSSVIPALGIFLTPWQFTWPSLPLISSFFALASAGYVYLLMNIKGRISAFTLLAGGIFYGLFLLIAFSQ